MTRTGSGSADTHPALGDFVIQDYNRNLEF